MITIKNNLNQPLMVGEKSLAADGTLKVTDIDEEIDGLVAGGHISIVGGTAEKTIQTETPVDGGKQSAVISEQPAVGSQKDDKEKTK